jgi:hypothetical protein
VSAVDDRHHQQQQQQKAKTVAGCGMFPTTTTTTVVAVDDTTPTYHDHAASGGRRSGAQKTQKQPKTQKDSDHHHFDPTDPDAYRRSIYEEGGHQNLRISEPPQKNNNLNLMNNHVFPADDGGDNAGHFRNLPVYTDDVHHHQHQSHRHQKHGGAGVEDDLSMLPHPKPAHNLREQLADAGVVYQPFAASGRSSRRRRTSPPRFFGGVENNPFMAADDTKPIKTTTTPTTMNGCFTRMAPSAAADSPSRRSTEEVNTTRSRQVATTSHQEQQGAHNLPAPSKSGSSGSIVQQMVLERERRAEPHPLTLLQFDTTESPVGGWPSAPKTSSPCSTITRLSPAGSSSRFRIRPVIQMKQQHEDKEAAAEGRLSTVVAAMKKRKPTVIEVSQTTISSVPVCLLDGWLLTSSRQLLLLRLPSFQLIVPL